MLTLTKYMLLFEIIVVHYLKYFKLFPMSHDYGCLLYTPSCLLNTQIITTNVA